MNDHDTSHGVNSHESSLDIKNSSFMKPKKQNIRLKDFSMLKQLGVGSYGRVLLVRHN